jgi:Tfp pilus assembly protein PilN
MHSLELDYVAPPRRRRWPGFAVLALSLAVAAGVVGRYRDARAELAALEAAQGLVNVDRAPVKSIPRERLDEETKMVNEVVRQLGLPWARMIAAVEKASTGDVVVLQLQPEAQQRLLRLSAEAKSREAMLAYVRRLGQDRALADVYLVRHEVRLDRPGRPIQFAVQATLRDAR